MNVRQGHALPHPARRSSARRWSPTSTATAASPRSSPPAWTATSTRGTRRRRRCPASRCSSIDRSKISAIDPQTARADLQRGGGRRAEPGRDRRHARGRRPRRRRQAGDRRRHQRGVRGEPTTAASTPATSTRPRSRVLGADRRQLGARQHRACSRSSRARRAAAARAVGGPSPYLPGWPVKVGIINTELLPVVGEGVTGSPGDRPGRRAPSGGAGPKVGAIRQRRARVHPQPGRAARATARRAARTTRSQTDFAAGARQVRHARDPGRRAPDLRRPRRRRPSFLTPAAGVAARARPRRQRVPGRPGLRRPPGTRRRASSGPASRRVVNDLQFLTGPSVGRHRRAAGRGDRRRHARRSTCIAFNAAGAPASAEVAEAELATGRSPNPVIGSLRHARHRRLGAQGGGRDHARGHAVRLLDRRAAVLAGLVADVPPRPRQLRRLPPRRDAAGRARTTSRSTGDDAELQGARRRPAVRHGRPATRWSSRTTRSRARTSPAPTRSPARRRPRPPGTTQTVTLPPARKRFVAIRAVDDQGNVGPVAQIKRLPGYARPKGATPLRASLVPAYQQCTNPPTASTARPLAVRLVQPAAAGVRPADGRHARLERPGGELGRRGAARRQAGRSRARPRTRPT